MEAQSQSVKLNVFITIQHNYYTDIALTDLHMGQPGIAQLQKKITGKGRDPFLMERDMNILESHSYLHTERDIFFLQPSKKLEHYQTKCSIILLTRQLFDQQLSMSAMRIRMWQLCLQRLSNYILSITYLSAEF